jgi:hypothetical protein
MAARQIRRSPKSNGIISPGAGLSVDRYGAGAIDPSENVLALVDANQQFQEKFDTLTAKFNAAEVKHVSEYFSMVIEAERRRVDNLADLKKDYDKQISETQTGQMKTTSDLVSTQLDKVTTSLSDTINKTADNIAATLATMDKRLAGVEQFRYETGGRTSVSDPAMSQIASDLAALKLSVTREAGERGGASGTTASQIVAETLRLQGAAAQHGGNQNLIGIAMAVGVFVSIMISLYSIMRTSPPQVIYDGSSIHTPQRQHYNDGSGTHRFTYVKI